MVFVAMSAPDFEDIELGEAASGPSLAPPSRDSTASQPRIITAAQPAVPSLEAAPASPNHHISWWQRQIRSNRDGWSDEFETFLQKQQPSEDRDNLL
jgi:hypothetical protein